MLALLILAFVPIPSVRLNPQTVREFQAYMEVADRAMLERGLAANRPALPPAGQTQITPWSPNGPRPLTDGLVHDWLAAAFVPKASVADVVAVLQDYGRYREMYAPDVLETQLVSQQGATRTVRIRTVKKKVFTVVLDLHCDVDYRTLPNGRVQVWSRSSAIHEVDNAGTPGETIGPADRNAGFLWRLNTYWQLENRDGGVYMEFRAISLTRDIPLAAAWAVKPMVTALPRESLTSTIALTSAAVEARLKQ